MSPEKLLAQCMKLNLAHFSIQVCSICGITQTPVWRRLNKALVCNACGLKRRRSANVSRKKGEELEAVQPLPLVVPPPVTISLEQVMRPQEEPQPIAEEVEVKESPPAD